MSNDNVINMVNNSGSSLHVSPEIALQDAMEIISDGGELEGCKKLLILFVDEREDQYTVSGLNAGMKSSECLAVLEIAKTITIQDMGY